MPRSPVALVIAAGALLTPAALAQLQLNVDTAARHQTIEAFGGAASVTWIQSVCDLYTQASFASQLRDDLGVTAIRIEVPPQLEPGLDLNPNVIDWSLFDFTSMQYTGTLAHLLNDGHPGAVKILGAIWSPPWWMKTNQSETGGGHLRVDARPHFGKFCAAASIGFENTYGVPMDSLSIQNEPFFSEPFESCFYSYDEYAAAMDAVSAAFTTFHAHSTIYGPEDTGGDDPNRLIAYVQTMFADPIASARLDAVGLHQFPYLNFVRASSPQAWINLKAAVAPKPMWVTEISGESDTWLDPTNELGGGLYIAREIHDALVYGDVTRWLYWSLTDPSTPSQTLMNLTVPNPKYYAAKQFFRYVRPGAVRVDASGGNDTVLASAYIHDQQHTLTVVLINQGTVDAPVTLNLSGAGQFSSFRTIRSSETEQTAELAATPITSGHASLTLPPSSIVTLYATAAAVCYANCDNSTIAPVLNVNDFICFQSKFANGDSYANCDGSTTIPVLNVNDFICFQTRFANGCP